MAKRSIPEIITQMAEPICEQKGCEVVDVEWVREGGEQYLRIYIDRLEKPVDLELCEKVSRAMSEVLDKDDPTDCNYMLEVSSPGIERPLKKPADFERFAGKKVLIKLYKPWDGLKKYTGTLVGLTEEGIGIIVEGDKQIIIPQDKIAKINLTI